MLKALGQTIGVAYKATAATLLAPIQLFNPKVLMGVTGALAGGGLIAYVMRGNRVAASQQEFAVAQQQIQAAQIGAAMEMEKAAAGGVMPAPAGAIPQINAASAQHMGMMDTAPELARG